MLNETMGFSYFQKSLLNYDLPNEIWAMRNAFMHQFVYGNICDITKPQRPHKHFYEHLAFKLFLNCQNLFKLLHTVFLLEY